MSERVDKDIEAIGGYSFESNSEFLRLKQLINKRKVDVQKILEEVAKGRSNFLYKPEYVINAFNREAELIATIKERKEENLEIIKNVYKLKNDKLAAVMYFVKQAFINHEKTVEERVEIIYVKEKSIITYVRADEGENK